MGLAASQAKLLSITTRLSDNELRSQTITAAKMALSNQTSAASKKYINALNSTELLYGTYDMNGNKTTVALTGTALSEYAPLKNQYALINSAGQVLVSETQANYYEKSQNINDYLAFNGIDRIDTGKTRTVTNPDYEDAYNEWQDEYDKWIIKKPDKNDPIYWEEGQTSTTSDLYDKFLWSTAACYAGALGALSGLLGLPGEQLYDSSGNLVVEYTPSYVNLYSDDKSGEIILTEPLSSKNKDCYSHVLSHLLNLGDYKTTTGQTITISNGYGSKNNYEHWWEAYPNNRGPLAAELANVLSENNDPIYYCCQTDPANVDITESSSEAEKLMSDYYFDENGEVKTKSLQQKIVDLNYAMCSDMLSNQELYDCIQHFVNEDLKVLFKASDVFLEDKYNDDYEEWLSEKPTLDVPPTIDEIVYEYSDTDKAQWYVNLWHRMNGASDEKDGNQTTSTTNTTGYWNEMIHNESTTTTQRWAVLEDGLMNSSKWLQNALTQGTVTLEQVQFTGESTESNTGLKDVSWKSIIYSSAQDITEQTDETVIAKAEAEYERAQNDIEAKDKQFDNMLKLLDTEHEALQTEYESVQQVINKNISRTLKIYSA